LKRTFKGTQRNIKASRDFVVQEEVCEFADALKASTACGCYGRLISASGPAADENRHPVAH
jgi:hypothetical protein